jgi:hypothetical protein
LAGAAAPALVMLLLVKTGDLEPLARVAGPIAATGLMGAGMIGAAIARRLWIGVALALVAGAGLILLAGVLGPPALLQPVSIGLALLIASISFAARGVLFARSAGDKGWLIAVAVFAGEVSVVATAAAQPGALPDWLLALLPAQWATAAIQTALTRSDTLVMGPVMLALGGTAATTLLVAALWPRRWPYLLMFSAWLGCSALVYHSPVLPTTSAEHRSVGIGLEQAVALDLQVHRWFNPVVAGVRHDLRASEE